MHLVAIGGSDAGISAALRAREAEPGAEVISSSVRIRLGWVQNRELAAAVAHPASCVALLR